MNQELKLKWHSIYGQILFDRRIKQAWLDVKENKGAGGIDGITIESYEEKLDTNLEQLLNKLRQKEYRPSPVRRRYIKKKNGKMRPLGIPTIEDRMVQQSVVNVLQPKCEETVFHRWSCGYRPNYGAKRVAAATTNDEFLVVIKDKGFATDWEAQFDRMWNKYRRKRQPLLFFLRPLDTD